ncbi:MAG TPA: hypothetical protein VFB13_19140 [Reyranella sp.]|nr:hypothetical protein [Reyranella sp.]
MLGSIANARANNPCLSGLLAVIAAGAMIALAPWLPTRGLFLLAAIVISVVALWVIYVACRAEQQPLDSRLANLMRRKGRHQSQGFALVQRAGVIGCGAAYGYLGLANSGYAWTDDLSGWGLLDKRIVFFAYVLLGAFFAYHRLVVSLFAPAPDVGRAAGTTDAAGRTRVMKIAGALLAGLLAYCWLALPALLDADPGAGPGLAKFYEFHNHAQLGALEQMRQGAMPYLEAQTQYGIGNLELLYVLVRAINFSSHGAFATSILLDAACIVLFFIILQLTVGLRWAIAGMVGWMLWPSPIDVLGSIPAWGILTRWLTLPVLALLLARRLLDRDPDRRAWPTAMVAGLIWGVGGFLSQESLSGGILVFGLSLTLYAPASRMSLRSALLFSVTFLATGAIVFVASISSVVGFSHWFETYQLASNKAYLVTAGITNNWWSDPLDSYAQWRGFLQTYGFALLLVAVLGLLARFFALGWWTADGKTRAFVAKFSGVAVGAFALHIFSLLRSDTTHLSGPSFLLPLCLLMLPSFMLRCLPAGRMRLAMVLLSMAIVVEGLVVGAPVLVRHLGQSAAAWQNTKAVLAFYRDMRDRRSETPDLAARYSPLPEYQVAIRNHPDFAEAQEVFALLREHLHGRPVEFVFYRIDDLIPYPELFYFMGGFRSVSGITSPLTSIWVASEYRAWIDKIVNASPACLFYEPDPDVPSNPRRAIYQAWAKKTQGLSGVTTEPIRGRRLYGILSCKP